MPSNPLQGRRSRPSIYQNTGTPNGNTNQMVTEKEEVPEGEEPTQEDVSLGGEKTAQKEEQKVSIVELPPGPQVRRRRHKGLRFGDIYETRSLSIDKRLLPAFDDFMESGDTKTSLANQLVLKILIDAGYPLDPDILKKPIVKPQ